MYERYLQYPQKLKQSHSDSLIFNITSKDHIGTIIINDSFFLITGLN